MPPRTVHLQDLEGLRAAHQGADVAHRTDVDLAARQEGHGTRQIDGETALDAAEDDAVDPLIVLEGLLELGPGFLAPGLFAAQHDFAVLVLVALDEHFDFVTGLDVGGTAGNSEFFERDASFGLQSDVDHREVAVDLDDEAFHHGAFEGTGFAERLVQQGGEIFHRKFSRGHGQKFLSHIFTRPAGWFRRSSAGMKTTSTAPPPRGTATPLPRRPIFNRRGVAGK